MYASAQLSKYELTPSELESTLALYSLCGGVERQSGAIQNALYRLRVCLPPAASVDTIVNRVTREKDIVPSSPISSFRRRSDASSFRQFADDTSFGAFDEGLCDGASGTTMPKFLTQQEWVFVVKQVKSKFLRHLEEEGEHLDEQHSFAAIASHHTVPKPPPPPTNFSSTGKRGKRKSVNGPFSALFSSVNLGSPRGNDEDGGDAASSSMRNGFSPLLSFSGRPFLPDSKEGGVESHDGSSSESESSFSSPSAKSSPKFAAPSQQQASVPIASEAPPPIQGDECVDVHTATIETGKLKALCQNFGLTFDVQAFVEALDANGDGTVDFEEFLTLLSSNDEALEAYLPSFIACGGEEHAVDQETGNLKPLMNASPHDDTVALVTTRNLQLALPYLPQHIVEDVQNQPIRNAALDRKRSVTNRSQRALFANLATPQGVLSFKETSTEGKSAAVLASNAEIYKSKIPFERNPTLVTLPKYAEMMRRWGKRPKDLNLLLQEKLKVKRDAAIARQRLGGAKSRASGKPDEVPHTMKLLMGACAAIANDEEDIMHPLVAVQGDNPNQSSHDVVSAAKNVATQQQELHTVNEGQIGSNALNRAFQTLVGRHERKATLFRTDPANEVLDRITLRPGPPRFSPKKERDPNALTTPRKAPSPPADGGRATQPGRPPSLNTAGTPVPPNSFRRPDSSNIRKVLGPSPIPNAPTTPQPQMGTRGRRQKSDDYVGAGMALFATPSDVTDPSSPLIPAVGKAAECATKKVTLPPDDAQWVDRFRQVLMDPEKFEGELKSHIQMMQTWARCSSRTSATESRLDSRASRFSSQPSRQATTRSTSLSKQRASTNSSLGGVGYEDHIAHTQQIHIPTRPNTAGRTRQGSDGQQQVPRLASASPVLHGTLLSPHKGNQKHVKTSAAHRSTSNPNRKSKGAASATVSPVRTVKSPRRAKKQNRSPRRGATSVVEDHTTSPKKKAHGAKRTKQKTEKKKLTGKAQPSSNNEQTPEEEGLGIFTDGEASGRSDGPPMPFGAPEQASGSASNAVLQLKMDKAARRIQQWICSVWWKVNRRRASARIARFMRGFVARLELGKMLSGLRLRDSVRFVPDDGMMCGSLTLLSGGDNMSSCTQSLSNGAESALAMIIQCLTIQRVGRGFAGRREVSQLKVEQRRYEEEHLLDDDEIFHDEYLSDMLYTTGIVQQPVNQHHSDHVQVHDDNVLPGSLGNDAQEGQRVESNAAESVKEEEECAVDSLGWSVARQNELEMVAEDVALSHPMSNSSQQPPGVEPTVSDSSFSEGLVTSGDASIQAVRPPGFNLAATTHRNDKRESSRGTSFNSSKSADESPTIVVGDEAPRTSSVSLTCRDDSVEESDVPRGWLNFSTMLPRGSRLSIVDEHGTLFPFGDSAQKQFGRAPSGDGEGLSSRNPASRSGLLEVPFVPNPFTSSVGSAAGSEQRRKSKLLCAAFPSLVRSSRSSRAASILFGGSTVPTSSSSPIADSSDRLNHSFSGVVAKADVDLAQSMEDYSHVAELPMFPSIDLDLERWSPSTVPLTVVKASMLISSVVKGFFVRHQLRRVRWALRFSAPCALLQRVMRGFRSRRRSMDLLWSVRDARKHLMLWQRRHSAAIRIQCAARKLFARQQLLILQRRSRVRTELRVVSEVPNDN